jgi:6-phosphofructokinase 2
MAPFSSRATSPCARTVSDRAASVSGAGDSFLAAMVWSLLRDGNLETALRYGVAGGSAALLSPGRNSAAEDVHRL